MFQVCVTKSLGIVAAVTTLAFMAQDASAATPSGAFGVRHVVAQPPAALIRCTRGALHVPCYPGVRQHTIEFVVGPPRLPSSASHDIAQAKCPGAGLGAVCGTVNVPLDRKHPNNGKIAIFFELFPHYRGGPAVSAMLWNSGGPGSGTTDPIDTFTALSLMSGNLDVHDLLLIDDRGRGYSGTVVCNDLQYNPRPFDDAVADCAAQLGVDASRYGTGDIAQDTEAVRAALGYDKVDYYGQSYGGMDVAAYATRFGSHLRSLVLDAPAGTPYRQQFPYLHLGARSEVRKVRLACAYSPTCSADHLNPDASLVWLIRRVRSTPVVGIAYDASGNLVHVRVDEKLLLNLINGTTGYFASTGEIVAAAEALRKGDPAPVLRLGAEGYVPFPPPGFGDPTVFAAATYPATFCMDYQAPFDWSATTQQRLAQYDNAVAGLPADYFAPFSKSPTTSLPYALAVLCAWWQKPTPPSPVTPPQAVYPNVPTLMLSGDMDDGIPTELVAENALLYPDSTLIVVAEAGHITSGYSLCALNLASQFIETKRLGNTNCTKVPEIVAPAVARFPILAKDAIPATVDPSGHNRVGIAERKAVTVAVAAATDALQRSTFGSGKDYCLRAGAFQTTYGAKWTSTLRNCAFAVDVLVNGTLTWNADRSFIADLSLHGSGTAGGTIHAVGTWQAQGPVGFFKILGTLGGLNVALLVPEA
ncbi:MAG: hypothetical protein NVSMB64_04580 [Candidatus Velthaea sp.]